MADGQDFLSLGIDISTWDEEKKARLQQYIALFDQLSKYDGKVINPILGPGLTELNSSISQTSKLLDEINSKLTQFTSNSTAAAGATRAATSTSKELTDEQAKQKVQIQELNKLKIAQAQAENTLSQSRLNARNAVKEQFASETQLANQQKKDSALVQELIKQQAKAEEALAQQQIRDSKIIAALKKKDASERSALIKQQIKDEEQISIQQERDLKTIQKLKAEQEAASKRSVAQSQKEQAANKLLRDDYYQLTLALKEQAAAYSNLYISAGKSAPETKAALEQYGQTAGVINQIDKKLQSAQPSAFGLGKGLSTMYNHLRMIAYILPGIGVAGIFDIAGQAIAKAAEELGLFDDRTSKYIDRQNALNKSLKEEYDLYDGIIAKYRKLREVADQGRVTSSDAVDFEGKQGYDDITLQTNKRVELERNLLEVQGDILKHTGNSPETLKLDLQRRLAVQKDYADQIKVLNTKIDKASHPDVGASVQKDINGNPLQIQGSNTISKGNLELLNKQKDGLQKLLDLSNEYYKNDTELLDKYQQVQKDIFSAKIEELKLISDNERKLFIDNAKSEISVQQNKSSIILSDIRSTHEEKLKALREEHKQQVELNGLEHKDVVTDISSNTYDVRRADKKQIDDNRKASDKLRDETLKENIDFYQKELKAKIDIQKDLVNQEAVTNEKIQNNDKSSLKERLEAYSNYIIEKTKLEQLDFELASSAGKSFAGDKGSLTPNQVRALQSARDTAIVESKADAESKIYEIVYSSGQRQLKAIEDEYESEQVYSKENLINDLVANNAKYDRREESLKKWQKRKKEIEDKDKKDEFQKDLDRDTINFKKLLDLRTQREDEYSKSQSVLKSANDLPDGTPDKKFTVNQAKGSNEANLQLLKDTNKELKKAGDQVITDRYNLANVGKDAPTKLAEFAKMFKEIENELYKDIKSFVDAGYEYKLSMLEKNKAIIDEQYSYEEAAIQKSSLSAKDKAALDIQIAEQKREFDKKTQNDERQLKIQQAAFDKKMAIAHIILSTAAGVAEAIPNPAKEIAAGVVGALELATAIATPIPSFKEGVTNFKGGKARYAEAGMEVVKEPGKQARLVMTETISYLPKGTDIIPVKDSPVFEEKLANNGWDQTLFLAKEIKKLKQEPKKITNVIKIDLGFETYKKRVLGNG